MNTCEENIPSECIGISGRIKALESRVSILEGWNCKQDEEQTPHMNRVAVRQYLEKGLLEYGMEEAADELLKLPLSMFSNDNNLIREKYYYRMLLAAFTWLDTPQGHLYWGSRWRELKRRESEESTERKDCTTCRYRGYGSHVNPCFRCMHYVPSQDDGTPGCWTPSDEESKKQNFRIDGKGYRSSEDTNPLQIQTIPRQNRPECRAYDVLNRWLKENGYDGLIHPSGECACFVDEIMDCPIGFYCDEGCMAASSAYGFRETEEAKERGDGPEDILEPADPWTWRCDRCKLDMTVHWHPNWKWDKELLEWQHRCLGDHWNSASPVWEKDFA